MIDHVWSVVCGRSSTDRETNNISLFDVIEQLNVLGPLPPPQPGATAAIPIAFELVSVWSRANPEEGEDSTGRVRLLGPNGNQLFENTFPVSLIDYPRMRTQLRTMGFPLVGTGRYTFVVEIQRANSQWESVARIPVQLESVAQPAAPAGG